MLDQIHFLFHLSVLAETDWSWLSDFWPHLTALFIMVITILASAHAVLFKRDTRSTIGWVGIIFLAPVIGTALYVLLGINRIRRRANALRGRSVYTLRATAAAAASSDDLDEKLNRHTQELKKLERLMRDITRRPLLIGNKLEPLRDGDEAYPALLAAIDSAQHTVGLSTYIFDRDRAGQLFADAIARAVKRGVEVRVLIDDVGSRYSFPSIVGTLRRTGAKVERFLRTIIPSWFAYANLRSHRKILVVDGKIGFTGGMNIREACMASLQPNHTFHDLHFRIVGPVVSHLAETFADDWRFTTGEILQGDHWFPPLVAQGESLARGIVDGPDEHNGRLRLTILGALSCAQKNVCIMTPYFLPDESIVSALNVASMRGVEVDIILPEENNLRFVKWACTAQLWQVLERNCRVWMSPPPFDHTKLMLVDGAWALIGSANWDPRSLRLNFEFNVEVYDAEFAGNLEARFHEQLRVSRQVTLAEVDARSLPARLRDGVVRLLTPYL